MSSLTQATNGTPADPPSPLDIELAVLDVTRLVALSQWIESARLVIDNLNSSRRSDEDLDAKLKDLHIPYCIDWEDDESAGLHALLNKVYASVATLQVRRPAT